MWPIESLATENEKGKDLNMSTFQRSLFQAFQSLLKFKILMLALLPAVASFVGLFILYVVSWQSWVTGLSSIFSEMTVFQWIEGLSGLESFSVWIAVAFLLFTFIPLLYLFSVLLTSLFLMPIVLKVVGDEFKYIEKKRGGSVLGSVCNTLFSTVLFLFAFAVTLPLWLLPGSQILVPLLLTAWLNKKIFLYDVLQDFATKEERKRIEKEENFSLYGMGMLLGLLSYIPLAFFFIPILAALSYTYFGLYALSDRRR